MQERSVMPLDMAEGLQEMNSIFSKTDGGEASDVTDINNLLLAVSSVDQPRKIISEPSAQKKERVKTQ